MTRAGSDGVVHEVSLERPDDTAVRAALAALATLLRDVVDGGASIGFLPPLAEVEARAYWESVAEAVGAARRVLLVARADGVIAGSGQLDLETRANGRHRAEVMKVMVRTDRRRHGLGRALMLGLEAEARRHGRTTLVLDTRQGDPSERLYSSLGWHFAGAIPRYARSADGTLQPTAFYYKLLDAPAAPAEGGGAA